MNMSGAPAKATRLSTWAEVEAACTDKRDVERPEITKVYGDVRFERAHDGTLQFVLTAPLSALTQEQFNFNVRGGKTRPHVASAIVICADVPEEEIPLVADGSTKLFPVKAGQTLTLNIDTDPYKVRTLAPELVEAA